MALKMPGPVALASGGVQLLALETGGDIISPSVSITYDEALEGLFGAEADALCTARQTHIDAPTRARLLQEIGRAVKLVGGRLTRYFEGDYALDENLVRFSDVEPLPSVTPNRSARARRQDHADGYHSPSVEEMKAALDAYPRYGI